RPQGNRQRLSGPPHRRRNVAWAFRTRALHVLRDKLAPAMTPAMTMTRRELIALGLAAPFLSAADNVDQFFETFFLNWVRQSPEQATAMRILPEDEQARLDSQLNDISDEAAHARVARAKEGLAALAKFDRKLMTPAQQFSASMLEYQLN